MKKKSLLLAASCVVVLLVAIFLPSLCWNAHLNDLTKEPDLQTLEISDNMHVTRPEEFADLFVSGAFLQDNMYNDVSNSRGTEFEQLKEMFANIFNYLEPEAKAFYLDCLSTSNFEYSNIQPVSITTNVGPEYFAMVNGQLSYYGGDEILYFFVNYEQKTQTVFFFSIHSDWIEKDDGFTGLKYSKELAEASTKYYSDLGISDKYYSIESDNYGFSFYLYVGVEAQKNQALSEAY